MTGLEGFLTGLFTCFIGISGYVHWRYNYLPWKVLRRDIQALSDLSDARYQELKGDLGLRRAAVFNDEQEAEAERRLRARRIYSSQVPPGV